MGTQDYKPLHVKTEKADSWFYNKRQNFGSMGDTYSALSASGDSKMETSESQVSDSPYGSPPFTGNDGSHTNFVVMTRGCPYPRTGNVHISPTTKMYPKIHPSSNLFILGTAGDIPAEGRWMGNLSMIPRGKGVTQRLGDKILATGLSLNLAITVGFDELTNYSTSSSTLSSNTIQKKAATVKVVIFARKDSMGSTDTDPKTIYSTIASPTERVDNLNVSRTLDFTGDITVLHVQTIDFNAPFVQPLATNPFGLVSPQYVTSPSITRVIPWECTFPRGLPMLYSSTNADAEPEAQLGASIQWAIYTSDDASANEPCLNYVFEMESHLFFNDD